ncbi:MAG TPA: Flp family type IVb pilin [Dehalococcoidia bacterium]|nr:Flp family type IVb pilin [Dehalococcoidia bacterium]
MQYAITLVNELVNRLQTREEGQGLVEYALIIALVSITAIAALGILSGDINGVFTSIGGTLAGA